MLTSYILAFLWSSHKGFLPRYVQHLKDMNFLREDLIFTTHSTEVMVCFTFVLFSSSTPAHCYLKKKKKILKFFFLLVFYASNSCEAYVDENAFCTTPCFDGTGITYLGCLNFQFVLGMHKHLTIQFR